MDLTPIIAKQRAAVIKADQDNLDRLSSAFAAMFNRAIQARIEAFELALAQLEEPTVAEIKRLPQYKAMLEAMGKELDRYTVYIETAIGIAAGESVSMGLVDSAALVTTLTGANYAGLQPNVVQQLLKFLDPSSPLYARLAKITDSTLDAVIKTIIDGAGSGFNPRKIASLVQDAFARGLTDALRNMRTVQIWSYRESARANYIATDGIVQGWIWFAELDTDVCMSCVAQHGSVHPLTETLDDHDNGRCSPIPYIPDLSDEVQAGQAWFESQSDAIQRTMMGNARWDAWKAGKFEFAQLSQQHEDERYGTMRYEASLKSLVGE